MRKTCDEFVNLFNGTDLEPARKFADAYLMERQDIAPEVLAWRRQNPLIGIQIKEATSIIIQHEIQKASSVKLEEPKYRVAGIKADDVLNVRSGPGADFNTAFTVEDGVGGITLVGKSVMNGTTEWVQVKVREHMGWVRKKFLKPSSD